MLDWIIDAKAFEYERHYSDCKKSNYPFIKARKNLATGNYLVFLDMATYDSRLSEIHQKYLKKLFENTMDTTSDSHCEITKEFCNFDGISPVKLNEFLFQVFTLVTQDK